MFEGEFLNGEMWNGKGIEYEEEELGIKVEYFNGQIIKKNNIYI